MADRRRPGSGRPAASRARATAPRTTPRTPVASPGPRGLTTRAAVLGLGLCALLVAAALPMREYLAQRAELAAAEEANAAARQRVAELEHIKARQSDPAFVKAQAREKLHFVMPGETSYLLIPVTPAPTAAARPSTAPTATPLVSSPEAPWYSQLYATVQAADER
jgi:cell division protein FtsB